MDGSPAALPTCHRLVLRFLNERKCEGIAGGKNPGLVSVGSGAPCFRDSRALSRYWGELLHISQAPLSMQIRTEGPGQACQGNRGHPANPESQINNKQVCSMQCVAHSDTRNVFIFLSEFTCLTGCPAFLFAKSSNPGPGPPMGSFRQCPLPMTSQPTCPGH